MNKIGLKINPKNTQVVHMNTTNCNPILFNKKPLEDVGEFIYMGSKVTTPGDCDTDINTRISKAKEAFAILKSTWT